MLEFSWELLAGILVTIQAAFWIALHYSWKSLETNKPDTDQTRLPPASVILCAHNEMRHLPKLVDILVNQNYPNYEVVLVDDRSDDGLEAWAKSLKNNKIKYIRIAQTPQGWSPKKWTIQTGIEGAKHDWLAFTDADCEMTENWLNSLLSESYKKNVEVILGYSPYRAEFTWVNQLIQTETFLTATLYLGTTQLGFPYMAVGRNMAYKRCFEGARAQKTFKSILSGDDDLIINNLSSHEKTVSCIYPESFVYSEPKKTLAEWLNQKARHYGASFHYSIASKIFLIMFHGSFFLLLIGFFSGLFPLWIVLFRSFAQYFAVRISHKKLKHTQPAYLVCLLEPVLFVFQLLLVSYSLIKKPTWR